ncbi:MAG: DUF1269 domain-containing protein [Gammaproteobacteria bacterium]|nr:MAG: DUF1269 domain-containing protein [Gammaproteobacteria bacterium]
MNTEQGSSQPALITAIFPDMASAHRLVEQLIEEDFPMDQISVLHRAEGEGDDFLGIAYADDKERVRVWSEQGAFWGSLAGLLAGASGMFLVPGVGTLLLVGPVINALTGAVLGAGLMAGSALATRLAVAFHRLGIPQEILEKLHTAIMDGKTVLLLHGGNADPETLRRRLDWHGAEEVLLIPAA